MIEFDYDRELGARVATFSGTVDDQELLGSYGQLLASEDYDPRLNDLVDMRPVTRLDVSGDAIRELVRAFTPLDPAMTETRLAIVAGSDVVFGMARMYELLRSDTPEEIRVFRDIDQARAWLKQGRERQQAS